MSSVVHSLFLLPESRANIVCKDGLTPFEVNELQKFFNFGGLFQFQNCTAPMEYAILHQSKTDMEEMMRKYPART